MNLQRQATESSEGAIADVTEEATEDATVLVLCPAYNAAGHLPELLQRIGVVCDKKDVLVVDDGSADNSVEILNVSGARYLRLKSNHGKGAALKTGYRWARKRGYKAVLSIDSDLQHAPEDIPRFLVGRADFPQAVLLGCREFRAGAMPLMRQLSNNLSSLLVSIFSGKRIRDSQCGFRLLPLQLLAHAPAKSARFMYESETLFMLGVCGAEVRETPIRVIYNGSQSHINPLTVILKFIRLFWRRLWY